MNGLELSKAFYNECGKPMLHKDFAEYEQFFAVGLVGSGSECYGYDDKLSQDHDFEPGFCIFIPGEDIVDYKVQFQLERAYAKLPKEFKGFKRSIMNPVGGNRHGVIRIGDFYMEKTGLPDGELTDESWFMIPDYALAEAVNGEIFEDNFGLFTSIREKLSDMPEDIRLKKLAGNLLLMAQSGQYNYYRCMQRGETGAAQFAVTEFVKSAMKTVFLLNKKYMPYYKWSFRAMRDLSLLGHLSDSFEYLISTDNSDENAKLKGEVIEDIAAMVIEELKNQKITKAVCNDLEKHAYSVNDEISDGNIRNRHIMSAV